MIKKIRVKRKEQIKEPQILRYMVLCLSIFLLVTVSSCTGKKEKSISQDAIVIMDSTSRESKEIQTACLEIFHAYSKHGKKKIKEYLAGLPPFLQESSLSRLSALSRNENMDIVEIKKDTRVLCYKVKCTNKTASKSITLNIAKNSSGRLKLVGIN